jgi:ABC-2 type transport system permease protein
MKVEEEELSRREAEQSRTVTNREAARAGSPQGEKTKSESRKGRAYHPLIELTRARIVEFLREPEAVFWVFIFPVLLAFALGLAFRGSAPNRPRVAVEANNGVQAERIAEALRRSEAIETIVLPPADAARELRTGKVALVVAVNSAMESAELPGVTYRFDARRGESRTARLLTDDALQRGFGRQDLVRSSEQLVTETGARYIDFLIPGLIGLNLMGSGMWGLGFAIVQARTRKLLKRFAATPMRRSHYLLSFMLSRLIFLTLEVLAVIGFGWIVFGVRVQGSFVSLIAILLIGAMMFAGLGLLIAARPNTIEGVSGWMNLVMLPMWLTSGTFFASSRFPEAVQPFIQILPLTALNDSLRAVINEAAPIGAVLPDIGIMMLWGILSFVAALKIFRWQ